MLLNNGLDNRQSQAIAFNIFDSLIASTIKTVEDKWQILRGNTIAAILYVDHHCFLIYLEGEVNGTCDWRIFDGIADQIAHCLFQLQRISLDDGVVCPFLQPKFLLFGFCLRPEFIQNLGDKSIQIQRVLLEFHAQVNLRQFEQILHQFIHVFSGGMNVSNVTYLSIIERSDLCQQVTEPGNDADRISQIMGRSGDKFILDPFQSLEMGDIVKKRDTTSFFNRRK